MVFAMCFVNRLLMSRTINLAVSKSPTSEREGGREALETTRQATPQNGGNMTHDMDGVVFAPRPTAVLLYCCRVVRCVSLNFMQIGLGKFCDLGCRPTPVWSHPHRASQEKTAGPQVQKCKKIRAQSARR